jgi:hypothetical protein
MERERIWARILRAHRVTLPLFSAGPRPVEGQLLG